jgi:hypothetical protein
VTLRTSLAWTLLLLVLWTGLQVAWLAADHRIVEGDELTNVGAVELFWEPREGRHAAGELARAYIGDFGEYPAMYPAITGVLARWTGVTRMDGDGPARVALVWAWIAALATWLAGLRLGGPRAGLLAASALMVSPQWSALQRHVMLENGVCALVAVAAAAGLIGLQRPSEERLSRRPGPWLVAGLAAGLALLVKQTAALALIPLAIGLLIAARRRPVGPIVAVALGLAVAAPWYVSRLADEGEYLLRSAQANPDAVGPLHQALYYPAVLLQQPWTPAVLLVAIVLAVLVHRRGRVEGHPAPRLVLLLAICAGGVVLLALVPKKYPRLLLPLLPLLAVVVGCWLDRWPRPHRAALAAVAIASMLATALPPGPVSAVLSEGRLGLTAVDERCYQDWMRAPSRPVLEWDRLLDLLEQSGGPLQEYLVASPAWPAPPCAHQTTLGLGEHLRIRVRRAGLETLVQTGPWQRAEEVSALPAVLISDGPFACEDLPGFCGQATGLQLAGRVQQDHPEWPLDLHVYRVVR